MESLYRRKQALAAKGITVRHATKFEEQRSPYGDKLIWVVDLGGGRQARTAYQTRDEALRAAEEYASALPE
jgi:hypothetical protein